MLEKMTTKESFNEKQKRDQWVAFSLFMGQKKRKLSSAMDMQKGQGGRWKVAQTKTWGSVYMKAESAILSSMWTLEKLPRQRRLPKVGTSMKTAAGDNIQTSVENVDEGDAGLGIPDIPEGSIANIEYMAGMEDEQTDTTDAPIPTPEHTPSPSPSPTP